MFVFAKSRKMSGTDRKIHMIRSMMEDEGQDRDQYKYIMYAELLYIYSAATMVEVLELGRISLSQFWKA